MQSKLAVDYRLLNKINITEKKVLNIGCAFPVDEIYFARKVAKWVAVDLSPRSIELAQGIAARELSPSLRAKIEFGVASANQLPFGDCEFEVTISFSTIDHIPGCSNRRKAIREMARVTVEGGYVIITVPNKLNYIYYSRSRKKRGENRALYGYEHCFTPIELRQMCLNAGLHPLHFASTLSLPEVDLSDSPTFQRPVLRAGLALLSPLRYFGRRMGYICEK